jgi:AraC family transcriptional regulator of adaptative response / DNA-3-methyladenine glycosylase II
MPADADTLLPDASVCEQARLSRDARFDGLFFTAVRSTRIYCRPVCPAPWARRVRYYRTAAAAEADGYRPCLRCRPELSPADGAWRRGDAVLARALKLVEQGFLAEQPLSALAQRVHLGERQLRRLFVERVGASPVAVHGTRRLLFAKQLLTETAMPITDIAHAAGFGSVRRFNASFLSAYRMAPRDLRKRPAAAAADTGDGLVLRMGYRPPYDYAGMLGFLRGRALPGVEIVDGERYARVIAMRGMSAGWMCVSPWPGEHALRLELHRVEASRLPAVVGRVRRMFDLDADPEAIARVLGADARLKPLLRRHPGLRIPSGWDGFEIAVRAILGQQVSVAAARTFAARIAQRFGETMPVPPGNGLTHAFPTPLQLAEADLVQIGLTRARAEAVRTVARAVLAGVADFQVEHTLEEFVARWTALPGIGPWTAHYIALRAMGHPDAFPAEDLVLQKALTADGSRLSARALAAHAERWRPWRAYAVLHLWRDSMAASAKSDAGIAPARAATRKRAA